MLLRRLAFAIALTASGALTPTAGHAQATAPATLQGATQASTAHAALKGVEQELDLARAAFDSPGLAVVVVVDGKVVLARGFGQRGLDDAAAVDADTRFAIGSCSKAFTSFGVGLLVDAGKLHFADRVGAHDPLLKLPEAGALERLTIADLLSQRSGLARHDFLWHARPEMSRADFAAAQGVLTMRAAPGRFGYTNSAYILAGRLVDLEAQQSWEAFTTNRIFAPLGMTRSNFSAEGLGEDANAARATKRAAGANRTVPWRDARLLGPAGAVNTTANDMGRWLLVLTGDGSIEGRQIMTPDTLRTLWRPVAGIGDRAPRDGDEDSAGYAMGWRVDVWRGLRRVSHSGAVDGFRARVTLFPDRKIGIAVMANLGPTHMPDLATRVIAERLLDLPRKTDLATFAAERRSAEVAAMGREAPPPRGRVARLGDRDDLVAATVPPASLFGVYAHPAYGEIRIEPAPNADGLRIVFGSLKGRLDHWRGDSYISFSDWPDDTLDEGEFRFVRDSAGETTGLTAMIDNDIAPIPFARIGPLPPPETARTADLLVLKDEEARPPAGFNAAILLVALLAAGVIAGGVGWAWSARRR